MSDGVGDGTRSELVGYACILTACVIWAGWIVATRQAMVAANAPLDIAILRYGAPALILAPIWLRKGVFPKGERPMLLAIMTIGWGGPFVILIAQGMKTVDAAHFGPLVPGLLPLVVALWERGVEGRRLSAGRVAGLSFIAGAVALVLIPAALESESGILLGAPWLIVASCGWAAFTIAFRGTGLSGIEAAAYVCLYSTPFLLLAAVVLGSNLPEFTLAEAAWHVSIQGVLSGIVAVGTYGYAIKALGVARASVFTSLVPVLAALGGWLLLGEVVGAAGWTAAGSACLGVLLVNRYAA